MRLMHLIERAGSRAGTRSTAGAPRTDPLGIGTSPSIPSARRGVVDCALGGAAVDRYDDGDAIVVGGVSWLLARFTAPEALGRVGALKTEELALV